MGEFITVLMILLLVIFGFILGSRYEELDERAFLEQCIENNLDYSLADREQRCNQALILFLDKKPNSN